MIVDQFKIGQPEGVLDAGHAVEMVGIAKQGHELDVDLLTHLPHLGSDRFLIIIAVAAQVVGDQKIETVVRLLEQVAFLSGGK